MARGESIDPIPPTVAWVDGRVRLIDQRRLPHELAFVDCETVDDVCDAIRTLAVRGAPAIGATAAFGVALAAIRAASAGFDVDGVVRAVIEAEGALGETRPTAVNLAHGARIVRNGVCERGAKHVDPHELARDALVLAQGYADADVDRNRLLGRRGAALLPDPARVLTHCNAGALACVGYGTAIGVIRAAYEQGKRISVWVDETRPVLQGARLTAWELARLRIDATVVADVMAGSLFAHGDVDAVIVGADRIAANGDVANKIGTYPLAVLAARHGVPFYVAAPVSTIDLTTPHGGDIRVEERSEDEVAFVGEHRIVPIGVRSLNRAFDITPAELVTAIITDAGVLHPPFGPALARLEP